MRRLTPQQKKELSYAKDRRNAYGENDKSSRTSIRQRKRMVNRANRRREQLFSAATGSPDADTADTAEQRFHAVAPKSWRKVPDQLLGDHVRTRLTRRAALQDTPPPAAP